MLDNNFNGVYAKNLKIVIEAVLAAKSAGGLLDSNLNAGDWAVTGQLSLRQRW
jgi:hypothetical protein